MWLPHFLDEETEVQRGPETGLRSQSQLVVEVELEYNYLDIFISKQPVPSFPHLTSVAVTMVTGDTC